MRSAARTPRFALAAALLAAALALGGCVMNTSGSTEPAPVADVSGKPLIEQPLSNQAVAAPDAGETAPGAPGKVDFSCRTDADCAIKNVGNCCGYYPACVNIDSPTFPEQVLAECARNETMAVCGFPEIAGCQCVEGRCSAIHSGEGPVR